MMRSSSWSRVRNAGCAASLFAVTAVAHAQTATWLGGDGSWDDATKWSTGVVPNSASSTPAIDVAIDGGNAIASNVVLGPGSGRSSTRVGSLNVNAGDTLSVGSFASHVSHELQLAGTLTIDGTLRLETPFGASSKLTLPGDATIGGNGTLALADGGGAVTAAGTLTIGTGLSVRNTAVTETEYFYIGATLGSAAAPLINNGHIFVDAGVLSLRASSVVNNGSIEIAPGAYLNFTGDIDRRTLGAFSNAAGTVVVSASLNNDAQTLDVGRPGAGGAWILIGSIRSGTLRGAGGRLYVPYLSTATLDGVTLTDNATIALSGNLNIINGIHGNGTITFANPEAIEGTGVINTGGTLPAGIVVRGSISTLFDASPNKATVILDRNDGRIRAENGLFGAGTLHLSSNPITNAGTLEVSDGNTLQAGTLIDAFSGNRADVRFIQGGTFIVDGGGLLAIAGALDLSTHTDILTVLRKADGSPYVDQQVVLLTARQYGIGSVIGTFESVTRGISVRYAADGIYISGTPTPEPGTLAAFVAGTMGCVVRRRR